MFRFKQPLPLVAPRLLSLYSLSTGGVGRGWGSAATCAPLAPPPMDSPGRAPPLLLSAMTTSLRGFRDGAGDPSVADRSRSVVGGAGEDGPSQVIIPCSTTLTIGDVAVPIPDYAAHPERVSWVMPGLDHTVDPLLQAIANTASAPGAGMAPASYSLSSPRGAPPDSGEAAQQPPQLSLLPQGNMFFSLQDPLTKSYLRWMAQKEALGQDMCLMGEPGPAMRWLVMLYSFLTRREVRVVYLNRDVTESDLKQRREIRNGTLVYEDQSAVAAAKEGQLLVLEGLERVERNVLPVINNLLENREMHLDNGAVLIHPARYDSLLRDIVRDRARQRLRRVIDGKGSGSAGETAGFPRDNSADMQAIQQEAREQLNHMGLLRVSENFRVIGITVPVPPYEGNPLDPPLRSRFQCLYVNTPPPAATTASAAADASFSVLTSRSQKAHAPNAAPSSQKELAALAARQDARLDAVRQLRLAIDAVNASTSDFATSSSSSPSPSSKAAGSMASQLSNMGNYEFGVLSRSIAFFPDIPVGEFLVRNFPWPMLAQQLPRGGNASSSVGQEEVRQRQRQYADILSRCGMAPPLLTPASPPPPPAATAAARGGERGQRRQKSQEQPQPTSVQQMGNALRDMLGGRGGGDGTGVDGLSARDFICSARIVGRTHAGRGGGVRGWQTTEAAVATSTAIPASVEQSCNYITRIENVRKALTLTSGSEEGTDAARHIVIADAVVATATQQDGKQDGGAGSYRMPIFLGSDDALPLSSTDGQRESGFDIAAVCPTENAVLTTELYHVLQTMLQLHATRNHICLLGPTGCGKTALIREFARLLGYARETMHLYADMTNKDLFQRRTTDSRTGNTTWDNAALVDAAIHGKLVVLDGIDKLPHGMLSSLQQVLVDQSASLFDGTVLKPPQEYAILKQKMQVRDPHTGALLHEPSDAEMAARRIFPIHPAFRVIATARPPSAALADGGSSSGSSSSGQRPFQLSQDVTTLFSIVAMPEAREQTLAPVLSQVAWEEVAAMVASGLLSPSTPQYNERERVCTDAVHQLLKLRTELEQLRAMDPKIPQLSFRQLLHLVRAAVRYPHNLATSISSALLLPLMTGVTATQVNHVLAQNGFDVAKAKEAERTMDRASVLRLVSPAESGAEGQHKGSGEPSQQGVREYATQQEVVLRFDRVYTANELALVPFVTGFYGNPVHEAIIAWLARQYAMRSNILLIGNQGVGKNKVVDAFLSRINVPRHYLQLHRDTTVGSLTINPTVEGGKVRWEDSPLVKAVQLGHCLVVDEIDKASVEVVQVLKGLIEDREMRLGDGRQIIDPALAAGYGNGSGGAESKQYIAIHPDFRIIVLANPPGFPFHGNDFFRECGDLFSSYVMGNPDRASQLQVLRAYAPSIPDPVLDALVRAFQVLQESFEQGNLTYPFSLRELIAVVKHLSRFPQDGVYEALNNVFNFDAKDANTLRIVRQVLHHHLNPIGSHDSMKALLPLHAGLPQPMKPNTVPLVVPFPKREASGGADFSFELPTLVHKDVVALRQALQQVHASATTTTTTTTTTATAALCWKENYGESAYAAEQAPHHHQSRSSDWFTEWTATMQMPFLRPATDTVLHLFPVTATAGSSPSSSSLVSFLISRKEEDGLKPGSRRLLLATVHLPSTLLEVAEATATGGLGGVNSLTSLGWPVGEVHFLDLSPLLPDASAASERTEEETLAQHRAVAASDFNLSPHHELFSRRPIVAGEGEDAAVVEPLAWPPSATLRIRQQHLRGLLQSIAAPPQGEVHWPTVLLQVPAPSLPSSQSDSCSCVLVDVLAGTSPVSVPMNFSRDALDAVGNEEERDAAAAVAAAAESSGVVSPAGATGRVPHPFVVENAFLSVGRSDMGLPPAASSLPAATPSPPSSPSVRQLTHVRAAAGIVCYTHQNTLYVWLKSRVVAVTLPNTILAVHFFTEELAVVTVAGGPPSADPQKTASSRKGILKLVTHSPAASGKEGGVLTPSVTAAPQLRQGHSSSSSSSSGDVVDVFASFAWLPNGLDGTIVDVALPDARKRGRHVDRQATDEGDGAASSYASPTDGQAYRSVLLQPSDLLGAVWVGSSQAPTSDIGSTSDVLVVPSRASSPDPKTGSQAREQTGRSGGGCCCSDISYMVIDGVDPQEGLSFRVYPTPPLRGDGGPRGPFADIDSKRHQIVESYTYLPEMTPEKLATLPPKEQEYYTRNGKTTPTTNVIAMNPQQSTIRYFAPLTAAVSNLAVNNDKGLAYAYSPDTRQVAIADTDVERVQRRYADWHAMLSGNAGAIGESDVDGDGKRVKDFKMEYSTPRKQPSGSLKHGETDDKEHHGGNTWAGGTGGTDTAGLGGIIGPYRLDKGNTVHQVSPEEKRKVPQHLIEEAKRMGREALKERLKAIGMSEAEYESYKGLQERVRPSIAQLRTLLMGLKAAEGERTWLKGQTDGVWDDRKLVEGIVGEKNVFKRRVDSKESNPFQQRYKKRCVFVLDVSASMYRFEGMDRRLTKLLESTVMIMEAFAGSEEKIEYAMIGHNGDSDCIPLVDFGEPPRNHKERMVVCQKMIAYAQYCWSGDNTVEAMRESIKLVTAAKGDAYFVFVVSDANLRQYGITPRELSEIISSHREVQMFCIFIATIGQQSSQLQKQLPAGHGYECMKTDMLPHVLRQIFTSVNLL